MEPVCYVEPNWVYRAPEDYSIYVDLMVITKGKTVTSSKSGKEDVIVMEWVADGSSEKVNLMGGSSIRFEGGETRSLTTNYTNTYLSDLREGEVTTEMFGIESIDIDFNSYYVPQVTIQFTDIRGVSLFSMAEMNHGNYYNMNDVTVGSDLSRSLFNSFFSFPYPTYKLLVKGFYGNPVTFTLSCSDFRASFDASTGCFKATVKFVGNTFSFFNDLSFNALLCSPYSDAGGKEYWEARKQDKDNDFYLVGENNDKVEIPTLAELLGSMTNLENKIESETADDPAIQKRKELEDKKGSLDALNEELNNYASALKDCKWEVPSFWAKLGDFVLNFTFPLLKAAASLFGLSVSSLTKDSKYILFSDAKNRYFVIIDLSGGSDGATLESEILELDALKNAYDSLVAALKASNIDESSVKPLSALTQQTLFTAKKENDSYTYSVAGDWASGDGFKECKEKILSFVQSDEGKKAMDGKMFTHGFLYSIDIESEITKNSDAIDSELSANEEAEKEAYERAMTNILGFYPSVYNFCKLIMAHVECFMKLLLDCAISIYDSPEERTPQNLGMTDATTTDMTKKEVDGSFVPPFPRIARRKPVPRHMMFSESGGENFEGGKSEVEEEEWPGLISNNFREVDFINGLLNGAKEVGKMMFDFQQAENNADTDNQVPADDGRKCCVKYPIVPSDMVSNGNPWGDGCFSSDADFAGKVFIRMQQVFNVPGSNGVEASTLGKADAENFAYANPNPSGPVLKRIQEQVQANGSVLTYNEYFKPIVTGKGADEYKRDGSWPWVGQTATGQSLATDDLGIAIYKADGVNIIPIESHNFKSIADDLKISGNGARIPNRFDKYVAMNDYPLKEKGKVTAKYAFLPDASWKTYERFFGQITDEYSALRPMFNGCVYDKDSYEDWYDGLKSFIDGVDFSNMENTATMKVKRIPGFDIEGSNEGSDDASVFGQAAYYKQTTPLGKAFLFLRALGKIADGDFIKDFKEDLLDGDKHFVCAPRWIGYALGAEIWYEYEAKNSNGIVFYGKFNKVKSYYPSGKRLRVEIESKLVNDFKTWAQGDFRRIDEEYSLKFTKGADHLFVDMPSKEQDAIEWNTIELYIANHDEHMLSEYVKLHEFEEVYQGEGDYDTEKSETDNRNSLNEVWYYKDEEGVRLNIKHDRDTSILSSVMLSPTMFITCTGVNWMCDKASDGNYPDNISEGQAVSYWDAFIAQLQLEYSGKTGNSDATEMTIKTSDDQETPIDLRIAFYHYIKIFYDKWVAGSSMETDFERKWKLYNYFARDNNKAGRFHFIDSFYNYLGDSVITNPQILSEIIMSCVSVDGVTLLSVMSDLLSKNRFKLVLVENFLEMSDPNKVREIFQPIPYGNMIIPEPTQDFVAVYVNEPSSKIGGSGEQPDDSFMLNHADMLPLPISSKNTDKDYTIPAFGVAYGMMDQSYFSNIDVSMEKPMVTEEALQVQFKLCGVNADTVKDRQYVMFGQDLFTIYSNNSYTCKVDMLGCAWIRPLMYFCLTNVPMFRGSYLIEKVSHRITPGNMQTTFTGVRMANTSTRLTKNWIKKASIPPSKESIAGAPPSSIGAGGDYSGGSGSGDLYGADQSLAHDSNSWTFLVERINFTNEYTEGRIYSVHEDGSLEYMCDTIEDKDRALTSADSPAKVQQTKNAAGKGKTAIPTGNYGLVLAYSPKYTAGKYHLGFNMPLFTGIPGFGAVLLHFGTSANWSEGCVVLGKKTSPGRLNGSSSGSSKEMYIETYNKYIKPPFDAGKKVNIIVRHGQNRQMSQAGQKQAAKSGSLPNGFVYLKDYAPNIISDLKYATSDNFMGRRVKGYNANVVICQKDLALALAEAEKKFEEKGYRIKVYDAYRPKTACEDFVSWANSSDTTRKSRHYPLVKDKKTLLNKTNEWGSTFIARRSRHTEGFAVDMTVVDKNGKEIDTGSWFDLFDGASFFKPKAPTNFKITQKAIKNREFIRNVMRTCGLSGISSEWWHFVIEGRTGSKENDFPVQ